MSLTDYLIKRKYPGHLLIDKDMAVLAGTMDIHVLKRIVSKHFPRHHIRHRPFTKEEKERYAAQHMAAEAMRPMRTEELQGLYGSSLANCLTGAFTGTQQSNPKKELAHEEIDHETIGD
jgi:hypothetical protein